MSPRPWILIGCDAGAPYDLGPIDARLDEVAADTEERSEAHDTEPAPPPTHRSGR